MNTILALSFVPAVWMLQAVAPGFVIPGWLVGALPILSFGLTEFVVRLGGSLTGDQKKALYRAVCLVIVAGLVLSGQTPIPFDLPAIPNPMEVDALGGFIAALLAYAGAVFAYIWGGGKLLHDGLDALGFRA